MRSIAEGDSRGRDLDAVRRWRSLSPVRFEWDPAKDALNRARHGIGFEEASGVFRSQSPWLEIDDEAHSDDELRYHAIGTIARGVVVVVCTDRDEDVVRIIGARAATTRERRLYDEWLARHT